MAPPQSVVVTTDPLIAEIVAWMRPHYYHIQEAKKSQGGWEVWAQLELLFALGPSAQQMHAGVTLLREEPQIWINNNGNNFTNEIIDFWKTFPNPNNPGTMMHWGIELKCRTARETNQTFRNRVLADFTKVSQVRGNNRNPAVMYAVAMTDNQADLNDYGVWNNVYYTTIRAPVQPNAGPIYLIWMRI